MDMAEKTGKKHAQSAVILTAISLGASVASAQEPAQKRNFQQMFNGAAEAAMTEPSTISGVFETRWPASTDDFIVDAKGALRHSDSVEGESESLTQIDISDSASRSASKLIDTANADMRRTPATTETGVVSAVEQAEAIVPPCGLSPLDPARIKILVEEAAIRHDVDPGFATAIVAVESNFDRNRNSPKGARGPMQLMPATAGRFNVDDVCDPVANIDGGVKYLRSLLDEFGNPLLVAAAYNAGEQRIYEYGGIPPFAETVGYVAKVVNHQLGLPMPAAGRRAAAAPAVTDDGEGTREVGVIVPRKTGSFVGGVMHF